MIRITCIGGPYNGVVREVSTDVDALELLQRMVDLGLQWELDRSQGTPAEVLHWGAADMMVRSMRALMAGRTVFCLGRTFRLANKTKKEVMRVGQELEDTITGSGRMVCIARDDLDGLEIIPAGIEKGGDKTT